MPKRLAAWVHVRDLAGRTQVFGPDDEVPDWAAQQITNPAAWGETGTAPATLPAAVPTPASPASGGGAEAPPRAGRGSGAEAWRRFAERHGVDVDQDASREDIIAACERAGVIEREE